MAKRDKYLRTFSEGILTTINNNRIKAGIEKKEVPKHVDMKAPLIVGKTQSSNPAATLDCDTRRKHGTRV